MQARGLRGRKAHIHTLSPQEKIKMEARHITLFNCHIHFHFFVHHFLFPFSSFPFSHRSFPLSFWTLPCCRNVFQVFHSKVLEKVGSGEKVIRRSVVVTTSSMGWPHWLTTRPLNSIRATYTTTT